MHTKKILIDLDGVLNEYGKEKFDENFIPEIKQGAVGLTKTTTKNLGILTKLNQMLLPVC